MRKFIVASRIEVGCTAQIEWKPVYLVLYCKEDGYKKCCKKHNESPVTISQGCQVRQVNQAWLPSMIRLRSVCNKNAAALSKDMKCLQGTTTLKYKSTKLKLACYSLITSSTYELVCFHVGGPLNHCNGRRWERHDGGSSRRHCHGQSVVQRVDFSLQGLRTSGYRDLVIFPW